MNPDKTGMLLVKTDTLQRADHTKTSTFCGRVHSCLSQKFGGEF